MSAGAPHRDPDVLRRLYHEKQMTTYEVADELGVSQSTIRHQMDKHGIEARPTGSSPVALYKDPDVLRRLYIDEAMSTREIADELGAGRSTIRRWMKRHGIERRDQSKAVSLVNEGNSPPWDPEELRRLYCEEEMSLREVGSEFGVSGQAVRYWLDKLGIPRRSKSGTTTRNGDKPDSETLQRLYWEEEMTLAGIGSEFEVSDGTVHRWMSDYGIRRRSEPEAASVARGSDQRLRDEDWLREQYVNRERTLEDIADELGCAYTTVSRRLQSFGVVIRAGGNGTDVDPRLSDPEWLDEQYARKGHSMAYLAEELGCSPTTVFNRLRTFGIETRGPGKHQDVDSRLRDEDWLRERYDGDEWLASDIAEELDCSRQAVLYRLRKYGIIEQGEHSAGTVGCNDLDLKFRSGWERRVAHRLDGIGADFEYEPRWIGTPAGRYLPDFVLGDRVVLEVKGSHRLDSKPPKLMHLIEDGWRVVLVGTEYWAEMTPHTKYVPYDGGECPGLEAALRDMGLLDG